MGLMSTRPSLSMVARARNREASTKAFASTGGSAAAGVQKSERISALAQWMKHSSTAISSAPSATRRTRPLARSVSPIPGIRKRTPAPCPASTSPSGSTAASGTLSVVSSTTRAKPGDPPATATRGPSGPPAATKPSGAAAIHRAASASRWSMIFILIGRPAAPTQASSSGMVEMTSFIGRLRLSRPQPA